MLKLATTFMLLALPAMAECPAGQVERKVMPNPFAGSSTNDLVMHYPVLVCPQGEGVCRYQMPAVTPPPPPQPYLVCLTPKDNANAEAGHGPMGEGGMTFSN